MNWLILEKIIGNLKLRLVLTFPKEDKKYGQTHQPMILESLSNHFPITRFGVAHNVVFSFCRKIFGETVTATLCLSQSVFH